MKKPKQSLEWEEDEMASPEEEGSAMGDMLDDDIIDLEDIVELPEGEQDDDEGDRSDVDVEILDLDSDLSFGEKETAPTTAARGGKVKKEKRGRTQIEDDGLESDSSPAHDLFDQDTDENLMDFSFGEEEDGERDFEDDLGLLKEESDESPADFSFPDEEKEKPRPGAKPDLLAEDLNEDLVDFSFPEEDEARKESDLDLLDLSFPEERAEKGQLKDEKKAEKEDLDIADFESLLELGKDVVPPAEEQAEHVVGEAVEKPISEDARLEALISKIESRLLDSVREVVEAKLPEVVRALLREEIERLRKES
jgi:hypothetical protein